MACKIVYKAAVASDLKRIDKKTARQILDEIEQELGSDRMAGKALKGDFKGLYSYRFGNYRVVYALTKDGVLILRISHRKDVYRSL